VDANGPVDLDGTPASAANVVTIDLGNVPQAEVVEAIATCFGLTDSPAVTVVADTAESMGGLSMKALVAIAEAKGVKINSSGAKAVAIARILAA